MINRGTHRRIWSSSFEFCNSSESRLHLNNAFRSNCSAVCCEDSCRENGENKEHVRSWQILRFPLQRNPINIRYVPDWNISNTAYSIGNIKKVFPILNVSIGQNYFTRPNLLSILSDRINKGTREEKKNISIRTCMQRLGSHAYPISH